MLNNGLRNLTQQLQTKILFIWLDAQAYRSAEVERLMEEDTIGGL